VEKVKGNDARDGWELETGNGIGQITFVICLKIRCFLPFVNILQAARTSIPPHSHYPDEHFGVSSGSPQKMVLMDWLQTIELADLTLQRLSGAFGAPYRPLKSSLDPLGVPTDIPALKRVNLSHFLSGCWGKRETVSLDLPGPSIDL
jgi:hypothetical protein